MSAIELEPKYYDPMTGNMSSYNEWCEILDVDDIEEFISEGALILMEYDSTNDTYWEATP